ncbi:hypothetical protein phi1422_0071 [Bdellovibrio phage phi1422]|uniref:hypothetical protein n=1 Tax=Bdellovibrio phage phi1422 TaxID=1127515 RepID=UPI0002536D96|nr:hypothetical protein F395_gp71 [Bdellovibrio phage phi1422]AFC22591.1 hypothetical protein phi1422_0071 [Bdellovibrio phage phi1422]
MAPAWLLSFAVQLGTALAKWAVSESVTQLKEAEERAEKERLDGIRNGDNAKKYHAAKTRAEQIRAAVDLLNRNDT